MPWSEPVNSQPISQTSLVADMIDCALSDTATHTQTLTKARGQPHVFDDATIDRIERVHREQLEVRRYLRGTDPTLEGRGPCAEQTLELDRLEKQNRRLRQSPRTCSPWPTNSARGPSTVSWP
jgi:hypothetical protein